MRLIDTTTRELSEFHGDAIPPYAILSHLWVEGQEISFREFADLSPSATTRSGFHKIQNACEIALKDGIDWIWIDTNCIDKASSAELTEAINSMYNWYRGAEVCYAYLGDVPELDMEQEDPLRSFRQSRWFHRGWTLQELIGPRQMVFYSQTWTRIGDRSQSLAGVISSVTGIEVSLLQGLTDLHEVSIAKKMSWAATRHTSRIEDVAYCLLGIFDVNIPLLYGEGPKAFIRLQEEIIRTSNDHTIFCWTRNAGVPSEWTSMLAPSPEAFSQSSEYFPIDAWEAPMPYSMTNLGLSIHLPVVYTLTQIFVVLDVGHFQHDHDMRASIAMQRTNPRRCGSNTLDRSRYLESPIMLSKEATDTRERYNLFIRTRCVPSHNSQYSMYISQADACPFPLQLYDHAQVFPIFGSLRTFKKIHPFTQNEPILTLVAAVPASPMFKHAILLSVDPSATKLLSTSRRDTPLGSVGYDIETHPPDIFDSNTSMLKLPAFEGGAAIFTSGLMRISFKSPQEEDFFLFFAAILTFSGREVWHCSVHFVEEFNYVQLALEDSVGDDDLPPEIALIHQCLRSEAWEIRNLQSTAHTPDESLFVSIGGRLPSQPGLDIRTAVVSAKSDPPHPVPPPQGIGSTHSTSAEEDTDYFKDSEEDEDEDWGSEVNDEEDEEDEMASSELTKASTASLGSKV